MKSVTLNELKQELFKDPEFVREYNKLEPEYQLARSLIAARIKRNLTQAQIAKRAKTNQASISRLETGSSKPSLAFLRRVASALDAQLMVKFEI